MKNIALIYLVFILTTTQLCGQIKSLPEGEYILSGITVEGIKYSDKNAIITLSGLSLNTKITYPGDVIPEAIKKLWKQQIFSNVQIELDNVDGVNLYIIIRVEERPRISKYSFSKISKKQAEEIKGELNIIRGQIFTETKKRESEKIITKYYHEMGYLNVETKITVKDDPDSPNGIIVGFDIDKKQKVKIKKIYFSGIKDLKPAKLKARLPKTKEKRPWRVFSRSKYIPTTYKTEKNQLVGYLLSQGYRDARILSDSVIPVNSRNISLGIKLYAGKKYYFRNITFEGNTKHSEDELKRRLNIKKGETYNAEKLNSRIYGSMEGSDISSLYQDVGHLFFRANPVEISVENDSIDIEIRIYEGPIAIINKIIIEGNTKTSEHVILREVRTLPGKVFSKSDVYRTQRELIGLGYFDYEKLQITPIPNAQDGTVAIKYQVEPTSSDQIFFQLGWGGRVITPTGTTLNGLVGTIGLQFNNFSTRKMLDLRSWRPLPAGDGQKLSIKAQMNGAGYQNYGVSFVEPWFGGKKPNSLGVSTSYSKQSDIWNPEDGFRLKIINNSVDLGRRLKVPDNYFTSFTSLSFRYYDVRQGGVFFNSIKNGSFNIVSIKQTIERNSLFRTSVAFPISGSSTSLSVELTPPWSLFNSKDYTAMTTEEKFKFMEFHKWKFQTESYISLAPSIINSLKTKLPPVLYARAQFGFLGSYNSAIGITPFERFYLGGDGLYGFRVDGREIFALRGYGTQPAVGMDQSNTGPTTFTKFTLELRQPLSLNPTATIWLHGFAEAGNAWVNVSDYNPFELKKSFGGGVRLFMKMFGLIGFDFAWPMDNTLLAGGRSITPFRTHFMIGQSF